MRSNLAPDLLRSLQGSEPLLWRNVAWRSMGALQADASLSLEHVRIAERKLALFAAPLMRIFPELKACEGIIESNLLPVKGLQRAFMESGPFRVLRGQANGISGGS
jgi:D-serine dehydratase